MRCDERIHGHEYRGTVKPGKAIAPTFKEKHMDGIAHDMEKLRLGLENCRLLAARHRKEDWALLILGFCAEAGVVGSITR